MLIQIYDDSCSIRKSKREIICKTFWKQIDLRIRISEYMWIDRLVTGRFRICWEIVLWGSLIELVEQLQLIKRPGEDYILDKILNETKRKTDTKYFG